MALASPPSPAPPTQWETGNHVDILPTSLAVSIGVDRRCATDVCIVELVVPSKLLPLGKDVSEWSIRGFALGY